MKHDLTTHDLPLADLALLPGNPRQGDIGAVSESMRVNGVYQPIIVNKGTKTGRPNEIIAGNHRAQAAKALGHKTIPAIVLDLTDEEAKRIALADNRTSDLADYDNDALLLMLQDLPDLAGTGYDGDDLDDLLAELDTTSTEEGLTDPDDVPTPPDAPIAKLGDVFTLGNHRVLCGDSTSKEAFETLMGDERADLVWTDPPYGVAYEGKTKEKLTIQNDALNLEQLTEFLHEALEAAKSVTKPGAIWYVAAPHGPMGHAFGTVLLELGVWKHSLVWVKNTFALGRGDYHYRHEAIFYGWSPGAARLHPIEQRDQDTVFEFDKPARNAEHPTMKPVALIVKALENSSNKGDVVLDPFGGSGSTLIACEQTNRRARLIELEPRYVDVICRRWQEHTGRTPLREGRPVSFIS
ncbi:MAG: DNA modification methylase [Dermabacter sp.]|nr:DNA modification methylase [Dermabacter sp.]